MDSWAMYCLLCIQKLYIFFFTEQLKKWNDIDPHELGASDDPETREEYRKGVFGTFWYQLYLALHCTLLHWPSLHCTVLHCMHCPLCMHSINVLTCQCVDSVVDCFRPLKIVSILQSSFCSWHPVQESWIGQSNRGIRGNKEKRESMALRE